MSEDIMEFRDETRAAWALIDPTFTDPQGYRDFFNEKYDELEERRKADEKALSKRVEQFYKPGGWMKALRELDHPRNSVRLIDRIHREILTVGHDFTPERKDEFKSGIELLGELMMIHDAFKEDKRDPFGDMFGEYLQEHGKLNVRAGQFFTPINVCDMMVMMTITPSATEDPPRICDPASGSGRFMLRTAKHYADKIGMFNFLFFNVDIDHRMYVSSTMNALLNGIPSVNILGNSISLVAHEGIVTMNREWHMLSKERAQEILVGGLKKGGQMKLTQPI